MPVDTRNKRAAGLGFLDTGNPEPPAPDGDLGNRQDRQQTLGSYPLDTTTVIYLRYPPPRQIQA